MYLVNIFKEIAEKHDALFCFKVAATYHAQREIKSYLRKNSDKVVYLWFTIKSVFVSEFGLPSYFKAADAQKV